MSHFARLDWTATTFDPETFTEPVEMAELHVRYRARFGGRPCHSNASICTLINRAEASSSRDARFNMKIRRADERGLAKFGWLTSCHTFSFGHYHDPRHMGFGPLRVINEDYIQPGQGFGMHGHRDMEIITYVLDGAVEHRDSMGNGSVELGDQQLVAGDGAAVMSAERLELTGRHDSEFLLFDV